MSRKRYYRTQTEKVMVGVLHGVIALAVVAAVVFGVIALIGHFDPLVVTYNDTELTAPIGGVVISPDAPLELELSRKADYKITTNQSIDFKLNGKTSEIAQGTDITRGFEIDYDEEEGTLTVTPAASVDAMLIDLFPDDAVTDVVVPTTDSDLFTLTLSQGDTYLSIGFRLTATDVTGLQVQGLIEF